MSRRKLFVGGLIAVMLVTLIAGCSTAASETVQPTAAPATEAAAVVATAEPNAAPTASGVDEAKQLVEALEAPVKFQAPGPAMNIGDTMKGKKIYFIANGINTNLW